MDLRNIDCMITARGYNKKCVQLIRGNKTFSELFASKKDYYHISDDAMDQRLGNLHENSLPTLILFCINLKREHDSTLSDDNDRKFSHIYSLEQVMPKKWQTHWSADMCPVYDSEKNLVNDLEKMTEIRDKAIRSIGDMTLINKALNSSLRNKGFKDKVLSENGIKNNASLKIAKEDVADYQHEGKE